MHLNKPRILLATATISNVCYRRFEIDHFGRLYRSAIDHRHSTNAGQCGRWEQYMYLGYVSKLRNKFAPDWDACCKLY